MKNLTLTVCCVTDRQKLSGAREEVVEEQQAQVLEDVPLRAVRSITVTPRFAQPFKYISRRFLLLLTVILSLGLLRCP